MSRVLFVFLDGIGLGPPGPENPLSGLQGPALQRLSHGHSWTQNLPEITKSHHTIRHLDATLGVDGLPQSGTGQATLLTGTNCAELVGRHFGPFPHSATYDVLDHNNLFHQVQACSTSSSVAFANAFPPPFFDAARRRWTVTTRCSTQADVLLRDLSTLQADRAVPADLTARAWREQLNLDVRLRSEQEAAESLVQTHRDHRVTLFEYFLTDKVGHDRLDRNARHVLNQLDKFFGRLLARINPETETLLVSSDHGNFETTAHTRHTRNPVPLFVYGWAAPYFTRAQDLTDVTPSIVRALRASQTEARR